MSRSSSYSEGGSTTSTATTPSITPEILSPSEVYGDHADQRLDNDTLSGNKRCFKCGDSGHLRNHCPTRDDPLYHGQ